MIGRVVAVARFGAGAHLGRGSAVRTLVNGEMWVAYGQMYVESDRQGGWDHDLSAAFAGQEAGLCGAAEVGVLWLTTGLHTGHVPITVELHDSAPQLDDGWEEIVEVSFRPASARTQLIQWGDARGRKLDLAQRHYRVRYCASGMDRARGVDDRPEGGPELDRYLLQFWPGRHKRARIMKQTSQSAAYWHDWARELPPPPTAEERAERERIARLTYEQDLENQRIAGQKVVWGGRLPSAHLRSVAEAGGHVSPMIALDPDLVHAIDAAGPEPQRAIALRAAHRACERAQLTETDWVAHALRALDQGQPLPPPLDKQNAWELRIADERLPPTAVAHPLMPFEVSQPHEAAYALFSAAGADPLRAALDTLYLAAGAYGRDDYQTLLHEIRSMLPTPP